MAIDPHEQARALMEETKAEIRRRYQEYKNPREMPREVESEIRHWAIERYTKMIALDPDFAEAYVERGSDYYFERERDKAISDMRKAYGLKPSDPHAYFQIAMPFKWSEKREILNTGIELAEQASQASYSLRLQFIQTYWYEGDFETYTRQLEELIPLIPDSEFYHGSALNSLAMGYGAVGQHAAAEAAIRRAMAVADSKGAARLPFMIVRYRMQQEKYLNAADVLDEFFEQIPPGAAQVIRAALAVLVDPNDPTNRERCREVLPEAERVGLKPGPLGNRTNYNSFYLGLIYIGAGKRDKAREMLKLFADESAANTQEWGVTMRWEIAKALDLVDKLA